MSNSLHLPETNDRVELYAALAPQVHALLAAAQQESDA